MKENIIQKSKKTPFIPIYKELFERYKADILKQNYPPGYRIHSINEFQHKHNVSRETAKIVLKMLSDANLIIQKPGKGSFVTDLGPCKKKWAIIIPFFSSFIEELIENFQKLAQKNKRSLDYFIDYNNWQEEINLVGKMINDRYEAVIIIPTFDESMTSGFYTKIKSGGTLVMLLDHTMTGSYFSYVIQSYDLGVKRAIQYLKEKCSGNLCFLKNKIWLGRNMVQEVMEETFYLFVRNNPDPREPFIVNDIHLISKEWIQSNNIKGIFCADNIDAIRIIGRINEWNINIPEELSIVSYGNSELIKYFAPAITSIDPHATEMAEKTVDIIKEYLEGKKVDFSQYVLSPELIIRQT